MPSTSNVPTHRLITDLAAELTDPALEILAEAGVRGESVAMELGLWHALAEGLEREVRPWAGGGVPAGVLRGVVRRAAVQVAAGFPAARGRQTGLASLPMALTP
jgi:hypothetical protein